MPSVRSSIATRCLWMGTGAAFGVAAMLALRPAAASSEGGDPCPKPDSFREVYKLTRNLSLTPPDEGKLYQAAVDGMLGSLDPYSHLIRADEWKAMNGALAGDVVGVGLEFDEKLGRLVTQAPQAGSPAAKAGVKPGMAVLSVDGRPARTLSANQLSLAMLGTAGTKVTLKLAEKEGVPATDVTLVRTRTDAADVDGKLFGSEIAYVKVSMFQDGVAARLKELVAQMRGNSGNSFRGVIVDVRHNPGGLIDEAVAMADVFVKDGTFVTAAERSGRKTAMGATGKATELGYPVAVLVDGSTASAAEVFAGALRERGRALLVGSKTFGKGTLQDYVPLEDGTALKITKAQYLLPSGRSLNGRGLEPDYPAVVKEKNGQVDDQPLKAAAYALRNWPKFAGKLGEPVALGRE